MPRVSVTIPTFNCARFLGRAIDSALAQTYSDYEIIVVDDGSTDETRDVVDRYGTKAQYVYQPNRGLSSARNLTLSKASGELIAYLDADDMWYPHKLERQVSFLDSHKECGLVHSDVTTIDEWDGVIRSRNNHETQRKVPQGYCLMDLLKLCHIQILTVVERRDCIERVGKFDERLPVAQDYLHWVSVALEGIRFGYIGEPLAMYRKRPGSLFSSRRRVCEDFARIFEILLTEKSLTVRCGWHATNIARARLYKYQRELAYLDRTEGRTGDALRRIMNLMRKWPLRTELYGELLKACIPPTAAAKLRMLKHYIPLLAR